VNSTVLSGDPVAAVQELKAGRDDADKDIVVTGSITLTHALIRAGVVDEYRMFVYPAVQGRGRPFFPPGTGVGSLQLVRDPMRFPSGIVLLCYTARSADDHNHERRSPRL
jgi:dihydrofolate reductase